MISFTIDIDWAPEEVIEDTLSLFEKYKVKCTIFSTHYSKVLEVSDKNLFEIGIHPNFNTILSGGARTIDNILDELLFIHPNARGIRSHSMLQSTMFLQKFAERKLLYDANHFLPYQTGIKPFKLWTGMVRIPYNWEDDIHWMYGYSFDSCKLDIEDKGLNVINFHPVHIFLNSESSERYTKAKPYYNYADKLIKFRNTETMGTRDLFISLLEKVSSNGVTSKKLLDVANEYIAGEKG
ncbi:MAG: hypothetical protein EHM58_13555 [Ignavibacteriae bacterium]|nr:MAG: hypothetical protein EHM58_13555 [Ignavibacteriota bacterium]